MDASFPLPFLVLVNILGSLGNKEQLLCQEINKSIIISLKRRKWGIHTCFQGGSKTSQNRSFLSLILELFEGFMPLRTPNISFLRGSPWLVVLYFVTCVLNVVPPMFIASILNLCCFYSICTVFIDIGQMPLLCKNNIKMF